MSGGVSSLTIEDLKDGISVINGRHSGESPKRMRFRVYGYYVLDQVSFRAPDGHDAKRGKLKSEIQIIPNKKITKPSDFVNLREMIHIPPL